MGRCWLNRCGVHGGLNEQGHSLLDVTPCAHDSHSQSAVVFGCRYFLCVPHRCVLSAAILSLGAAVPVGNQLVCLGQCQGVYVLEAPTSAGNDEAVEVDPELIVVDAAAGIATGSDAGVGSPLRTLFRPLALSTASTH